MAQVELVPLSEPLEGRQLDCALRMNNCRMLCALLTERIQCFGF